MKWLNFHREESSRRDGRMLVWPGNDGGKKYDEHCNIECGCHSDDLNELSFGEFDVLLRIPNTEMCVWFCRQLRQLKREHIRSQPQTNLLYFLP